MKQVIQAMFEQDRVIVRLQQHVLREEAIIICYLAGSYGQGTEDSYSDLDVVLVFTDQLSRDEAYLRRREFIQSVLPYVPAKSFDAIHVMPYFHIALYSNGAKVDYHFEILSNLDQTISNANVRILKDSIGWAKGLQSAATAPPLSLETPSINSKMLSDLDNRFWVMFMDIYRLLLRGDTVKSYPIYLELLHFTIPYMLPFLPMANPDRIGLLNAFFSQDATVTLKHLRSLMPAYVDARSAIVNHHHLSFMPEKNFEREILAIIRKT